MYKANGNCISFWLGEVNIITNADIQYPRDEVIEPKNDEVPVLVQTSVSNQKYDKPSNAMTSSVASALDDSTPSDSGVQLMDSMSSDMNESFMSNFGLDFDGQSSGVLKQESMDASETGNSTPTLPDVVMASDGEMARNAKNTLEIDEIGLTKSDIDNSNVQEEFLRTSDSTIGGNDIPDEMKTSTCSTFDTDAIVFRRKPRKPRTSSTSSGGGSVKKRVSFHEDILKNTKTDNIHIERGFVTYKGCPKKIAHPFLRNSWCSQGQCESYGNEHTCYRNACSDVLDYGQMDVFDSAEDGVVQFDNSGVFEYTPRETNTSPPPQPTQQPQQQQPAHKIQKADSNEGRGFYACKCSDSNSSLESNDNENGNDCKRMDYAKTKSNSCDCIGQSESNKLNNNGSPNMTDNCYYSEPSIGTMDEYHSNAHYQPRSVWCKELKPKSSCLKKTVRDTSVIIEHDVNTKVKKFNVHQLPDVTELLGSIKNIFSTIPERGVPEGCEDLNNVYECVPEVDSPVKSPKKLELKLSPNHDQLVQTPPGAKSKRKPMSLFPIPTPEEMMHVTIADDTMDVDEDTDAAANPCRPNTFRNKYIVNCESTVFEHTGVFENTTPDIPEIPSSSSNCVTPQKQSTSILSFSTAPITKKLGSFFSSLRSSNSSTKSSSANNSPKSASTQCLYLDRQLQQEQLQEQLKKLQEEQMVRSWNSTYDHRKPSISTNPFDGETSMTSSIISNSSDKNSVMSTSTMSTSTNTTSNAERSSDNLNMPKFHEPMPSTSSAISPKTKSRHLESPLRRKSPASNFDRTNYSPDLFCGQKGVNQNPMVLLSEEFDDLLTVTTTTTDTEQIENDIEIVDYSTAVDEAAAVAAQLKSVEQGRSNQFLRPPSSKSSLINRFLRNVTQKKINDIATKKNIQMSNKYKEPKKLFTNLYVKPKKPIKVIQKRIMDDFYAEIAQEMDVQSNSVCEAIEESLMVEEPPEPHEYGVGVGELSTDLFDVNHLHILRDDREKLIKVCS